MKTKLIAILITCLALVSCQRNDHFVIKGHIDGVDTAQMVYLEQLTLPELTVIDSAEVGPDGKFKFKENRPEYPELYQIRLGDQLFIFPVDSCERMTIEADAKQFNLPKQIEGSEHAVAIQELRQSAIAIQDLYNQVTAGKADKADLEKKINEHKDKAGKIIVEDPLSIVSYFALLQKVSGYYIFSPFNKDDRKYCAAVATSYHSFMPNYYRSKNLHAFVMSAIREERMAQHEDQIQTLIDQADAGFLDIALPNMNEEVMHLSSLRGSVVLIDFCAFVDPDSQQWMFDLRDIYNKYHGQGFDIYQISFDRDPAIWTRSAVNIPWACVYDATGQSAQLYNVNTIPTYFLMNKTGEIVKRLESLKNIDKEIAKLLKKG